MRWTSRLRKQLSAMSNMLTTELIRGERLTMSWSSGSVPVLRLVISSDISAAQFLHQDANDADEQNGVDLVEKHKAGRQSRTKSVKLLTY